MIRSFRHKGLKSFYFSGSTSGIQAKHKDKLLVILSRLDDAVTENDMNFPGSRLHKLKGEYQEFWSVTVNANWRIIFRMKNSEVYDVDYIDYH